MTGEEVDRKLLTASSESSGNPSTNIASTTPNDTNFGDSSKDTSVESKQGDKIATIDSAFDLSTGETAEAQALEKGNSQPYAKIFMTVLMTIIILFIGMIAKMGLRG